MTLRKERGKAAKIWGAGRSFEKIYLYLRIMKDIIEMSANIILWREKV